MCFCCIRSKAHMLCAALLQHSGHVHKNTSFAEQGNAKLTMLKSNAVHMRQPTVLWLLNYVLYRMAKDKIAGWRVPAAN
jgi:hypothetical protein